MPEEKPKVNPVLYIVGVAVLLMIAAYVIFKTATAPKETVVDPKVHMPAELRPTSGKKPEASSSPAARVSADGEQR